jgi:hypothetical protein
MAAASQHYEIVDRRGRRATEVKFTCQADAEAHVRDLCMPHLGTALIEEEVKRTVTMLEPMSRTALSRRR